MSMPVQMCGPEGAGTEERIEPESPEPQPMSRMCDGVWRERRERARCVMVAWMDWMREEVVYLRDSASL